MHEKSTDVDVRFCRRVDCLRKILPVHKMLKEVDGTATESCWNLTESPAAIRKADESPCENTESSRKVPRMHKSWRKSTEGPAQARNVDGSSHGCTESWHKVLQSHRKLIAGTVDTLKVEGRSHGCSEWRSRGLKESWQKFTEGPVDAPKIDGRFIRSTESGYKFTKSPADALTEVDGRLCRHKESWLFVIVAV